MRICINMQKNEAGEILDLKIPQSEWLRAFWPIPQEKHFPWIEDFYRNTANNINFPYRTNVGKINVYIFLWIQKTLFLECFWSIPQFLRAKRFHKKSGMHNLIRFSSIMPKFQETQCSNFKKTNQQTVGWKDRQILFHRTLLATARGAKSTTAVDCHLKVKDIENNVSLTKTYCLTVSMQKDSSIHKLIF